MARSEEELKAELESAKRQAEIDSNRRKIMYAEAEVALIREDKKSESIKMLFNIAQRYSISSEDVIALLECIPYI